ncbi:MAG: hypothetical protein KGJ07_08120 [Patescibacteria group bacterium]|nr:hypothetical protein [Patescibacteria group bacterium]MDE2590630.1 hypothetical protein [Patescibacteria group bacterium]
MELELEKKPLPWKHIFLYFIEFGFVFNIILLDIFVVKGILFAPVQDQAAKIQQLQPTPQQPSPTPIPTTTPTPTSVTAAPVVQTRYVTTQPTVKEYYVPFGTGQGSSPDWQNVAGAQAYIDSSNYPNIKQVVFEVTAHVPSATQDVAVRLFDETDQHPVWYSDVSFSGLGNTPQLLTSQPLTLDSGNKLYTVQMKTQLQATTTLDQTRIHITLQ